MNRKLNDNYIYLSEDDFNKYFSKLLNDPVYSSGVSSLKEGELYKIETNNKIKNVLVRIATKHNITVDRAFVLLMQTSDMLNEERNALENVTNLYSRASALKNDKKFKEAKEIFKKLISLCDAKPYLNQRKGGAYYHLALIAKCEDDLLSYDVYLKLCLKFFPQHKKARELLSLAD